MENKKDMMESMNQQELSPIYWGPPPSNEESYFTGTPPPSPPQDDLFTPGQQQQQEQGQGGEDHGKESQLINNNTNTTLLLRDDEEFDLNLSFPPGSNNGNNDHHDLWTEESVNLEFFDGSSFDQDVLRPLTPYSEEEYRNVGLLSDEEGLTLFDAIDPALVLGNDSSTGTGDDEEFIELSAEFQAILDSLPVSTTTTLTRELEFGQLLVSDSTAADDSRMSQESMDYTTATRVDDMSENILDALLEGDLKAAEEYASAAAVAGQGPPAPDVKVNDTNKKKSKKGEPASRKSKPRLSSRTDKVARKKEQNKTAATRYREKKKLLQTFMSIEEGDLTAVNQGLVTKRDEVQREVQLVKQLLRELFKARKNLKK